MRRSRLLLLLALTCAPLTACSPGLSGAIGLSVDDAGRTIVVLRDCKGDIDDLELFQLGTPRTAGDTLLVSWSNRRSPKGIVQFPLVEGAGEWKPTSPVPDLDPSRFYELRGWKKGRSSKAISVTFTAAELKDLAPGQILQWKAGPATSEILTLDEFTPDDCG
jgi:hypothetical protein